MGPPGDAELLLDLVQFREGFRIPAGLGLSLHPIDMPLDPADVVGDQVAHLARDVRVTMPCVAIWAA